MRTKLIKIGNSRGVRLPKAIIEQVGLREDNVELLVRGEQIIIRSPGSVKKNPRAGWDEQMRKVIAEHGNELTEEDKQWLDAPLSSEADKEWTW